MGTAIYRCRICGGVRSVICNAPKDSEEVDGVCAKCLQKIYYDAEKQRQKKSTDGQSFWLIVIIFAIILLAFLCEV
jgi:transcription elongation factor Elf1